MSPATVSNGRTFISFWLFGLINNILYVVILSAAVDLVGPLTPKAVVLLADVVPSFGLKLILPFFIHLVSYRIRIALLVFLSSGGMLIVATGSTISLKLVGVVFASFSSGLGEVTFLQLTHYYGETSLSAFSSGTGGAGLAGSFMFLVLTTWLRLSIVTTLILFSTVPLLLAVVFNFLLPLSIATQKSSGYEHISFVENRGSILVADSEYSTAAVSGRHFNETKEKFILDFKSTLKKLKPLVLKFMMPLFLVYFGEYVINQGISPTLLFPLDEMPFTKFRDAYVTYGTLYQLGVFISRSSAGIVRIRKIYVLASLQIINVIVCIVQSMYMVLPNVYLLMALVFYEGLLGGFAYVNTFLRVSESVNVDDREFALGSVGISDSAGIVCAGLISLWLEKSLCEFQKSTGRPWCDIE
ncbi:batten's disease protein Cln3 [Nadsonia fulvescens var. elongata DSM 6958]|uniref:Protein BTN n=1 Tax=Nadsonia fulvescens var. elongata DSM 6958 TaxID=857566 RepID=A0A1E3PH90_9ASCO|nr:batten's disease protein Cln3 [Nadsonia fulvescens var. elongata DSM 6958]